MYNIEDGDVQQDTAWTQLDCGEKSHEETNTMLPFDLIPLRGAR